MSEDDAGSGGRRGQWAVHVCLYYICMYRVASVLIGVGQQTGQARMGRRGYRRRLSCVHVLLMHVQQYMACTAPRLELSFLPALLTASLGALASSLQGAE